MNTFLNILIYKPLQISSVLVPIINLPLIYYSHIPQLLITAIPLSVTTILFHNRLGPSYIRKLDIFFCVCAYIQHSYIGLYYISGSEYLIWPVPTIFVFLLGKILEHRDNLKWSNLVHAFMHYILILGVVYMNNQIEHKGF